MPLGFQEIVIILFIVLLFFGPKKLPELFRSFGQSLKEFKKAQSEAEDDIRTAMDSESASQKPKDLKDPNDPKLHRDS